MQNIYRLPKRPFYIAVFLSSIVLIGNLTLVLFGPDVWTRVVLIDLNFTIVNLIASLALFYAAKRNALQSRRLAIAWGTLAVAQISLVAGDVVSAVLEVGFKQEPFPSLADGFYVAYYPIFLLGILLLPQVRLTRIEWFKTLLDASIVLLAAVLSYGNILLGTSLVANADKPLLVQLFSLIYPICDLLLVWVLLALMYRQPKGINHNALLFLALSAGVMVLTHGIFGYQFLLGRYARGSLLDIGSVLSYVFAGLAGVWQAAGKSEVTPDNPQTFLDRHFKSSLDTWITYLPFAWLAAAYLLLVLSHNHPFPMGYSSLAFWVGGIIGLALVRQITTLSENSRLSVQLQRALDNVQQHAMVLAKTNRELQVEIEERRRAEEQILHDALHDALTDLPNRVLFMDRLRHAIEYKKRHENFHFSVLFLDLDQFKVINDSLGHPAGDKLLIALAYRLKMCVRASDTISRLGGDEFVILLEDTNTLTDVTSAATRIHKELNAPFTLEGRQVFVTASIGIVQDVSQYERPEDILQDADIAMYHAKALGKARYEIFTPSLRDRVMTRLEIENELRYAFERNELDLHFQPILSLISKQVIGFEALLRWRHPTRGFIPPEEFIPVAEETGLILLIGRWVLYEACRQMRTWQAEFPRKPPLAISVNVSGSQFVQPDFVEQIEGILRETGLEGSSLMLEITESVYLKSAEDAIDIFIKLNSHGIQLQIDDFGTGYSSLGYLQNFPINTVKIDRTFVSKMGTNNKSEIVHTIVSLAHDLGMDAIAEGIETEAQLNDLKDFGCNFGQGYLLCPPVDKEEVDKLLRYGISEAVDQPTI